MGDVRFVRAYTRVRDAADPSATLRAMSVDELIKALAATSVPRDPLLVNVIATELQNRARRALAVAEHIAEGVVTLDTQGMVTYLNPAAEKLLGVSLDDALHRHATQLVDVRGPDDRAIAWKDRPTSRAIEAGAGVDADDLWLRTRDGRRYPITTHVAPIRADDEIIGAVVTFRDVTRERAADEALRLHKRLLDAVGQAVMATSPDGTILYWNRAAEATYGWTAEEVMGRAITEVTPSAASREQAQALMKRLAEGQPWSGEFEVRRRDGTTFLARVTNTPVPDASGRLIAIIGISEPVRGPVTAK